MDLGGEGARAVNPTETLPAFARRWCDDAATFPPGLAPLSDAVPAHAEHRRAPYGELVGPLVVAASSLDDLAALLADTAPDTARDLSLTFPGGPQAVPGVVEHAAELPVRLSALEVAVPDGLSPAEVLSALDRAMVPSSVDVFVELPRDERRTPLLTALPGTRYLAKFRTGGVTAAMHPGPGELADAVASVVRSGVPFKATAGLHHAVRHTDPATGFEQHGFLNLLLATVGALRGADVAELAAVLADTDTASVADRVRALDEPALTEARAVFRSFGTCSITDPLHDLLALGLLPPSVAPGAERTA